MVSEPQPERAPDAGEQPTCWWHPDRPTGLRCTRCERSACPECLREASVGYQCVDCVTTARREHKARAAVHRGHGFGYRTVAGARASRQVIVTPVLIALNVLVYGITVAQSGSMMENQASAVHAAGVLWAPTVADGDWWRLFTSGFLHYGIFHLLMNMLALYLLGRELEMLLGKVRFLALYFLSMFGGGVAVYLFENVERATAGASGAIYGLLGGILLAAMRLRLDLTYILIVIGINVVISFQIPNISWLGHLGGFAAGAIVAAAMVYAPARVRMPVQIGTCLAVTAALVALVLVRDAQFVDVFCNAAGTECTWLPG